MEQTATDKAIDVLFYLRAQQDARGITDISRALKLPKSSAHRMVATLARRGLLERDGGGRYRLGVGLLALGQGFLDQDPLVTAGRPVIEGVAAELAETCFLVAARAGQLVILDKAEGTGFLRASPPVGHKLPVRATAAGKLYLAHAPQELAADQDPEPPRTASTLSDDQFAQAVAAAGEAGFSQNSDEWVEGLCVLAAPVFSGRRLYGVLALAIPTGRLADMNRNALATRVKAAANSVSARLEGRIGGAASKGPTGRTR